MTNKYKVGENAQRSRDFINHYAIPIISKKLVETQDDRAGSGLSVLSA